MFETLKQKLESTMRDNKTVQEWVSEVIGGTALERSRYIPGTRAGKFFERLSLLWEHECHLWFEKT